VAIEVVNRQRLARIDARRVARLADTTLGAVGRVGANLTVAFVRDRVIRDLNRKFRGNDRVTDVLSFPADDERDTRVTFRSLAAAYRTSWVTSWFQPTRR